jgi:hypothetical protein
MSDAVDSRVSAIHSYNIQYVLDIDIPEEKTSTKTSNDEGDFIPVTVTKRVRRQTRKLPRPLD